MAIINFEGQIQLLGSEKPPGAVQGVTKVGAEPPEAGEGNVLLGEGAGQILTSGSRNTLIGTNTGGSLTTQDGNTLVGNNAGENLEGSNNTLIGGGAAREAGEVNGAIVLGSATTIGSHELDIGETLIRGAGLASEVPKLGFFGVEPLERQPAISSPTTSPESLKVAIDHLRNVVQGFGFTK